MTTKQKGQPLFYPFLFASFGEQVLAQLAEDESCTRTFGHDIAVKINSVRSDFETEAEYKKQVVNPVMEAFLDKACPSAKTRKPIVQWVVKQYLEYRHNDKPILAEDLYKIDENLKYFDSLKNSPPFKQTGASPDLLQYKTYAAFAQMLEPHLKRRAQKEMLSEMFNMTPDQKAQIMAETTVLYDGEEGRVVIAHTPDASKYWGSNTRWCISGKTYAEQMFPHYNERSPIIMMMPKGQSDNKVALVDNLLYNSADATIPTLSQPHNGLMKKCLKELSDGARDNLALWIPEKIFSSGSNTEPEETYSEGMVRYEFYRATDNKLSDRSLWEKQRFVLAAVEFDASAVKYAAPELLKSREFWSAAARKHYDVFKYAPPEIRKDKDIMLAGVERSSIALAYADAILRVDYRFMLAAVQKDGHTLRYASEELKDDRTIVMAAVKNDGYAIEHAAPKFKEDREIMLEAALTDTQTFFINHRYLTNDRDFMLSVVKRNGTLLQYAGPELKSDREVIAAAMQNDASALFFAAPEFKLKTITTLSIGH